MRYKQILIIFLCLLTHTFFAQEIKYNLEWEQQNFTDENDKNFIFSQVKDCGVDNGIPFFHKKEHVKYKSAQVNIKDIEFEVAPEIDRIHLSELNYNVSDEIKLDFKVTSAGNENYFVVADIP